MELNQLRGFVAVVQAGSFTRAAATLHLTQPALSLQVKGLEQELGERLLERHNRQVHLTAAGRIVLTSAETILGLVDQISEEIAALQGLQTGRLHIGTSDTTCLYVLPPLIQTFRQRYPGIEIHLANRTSGEVAAQMVAGEIDFGIVTLPVENQKLQSEHLFWQADVAICRPGHPLASRAQVTLTELVQYPLLLLEPGSTSRELLDHLFRQADVTPQILDLGSIEVIKRYVEIDLGVSIVPRVAVAEEIRAGRLQAMALPWLPVRAVGVVLPQSGYLSPAAQEFLVMLRAELKKEGETG